MHDDYTGRINRVLDHIEAHLDRPLPLSELAGVAHMSPYHFHRIFSAMMGEPLGRFVQRVRLEKAAIQLLLHPRDPVTRIALDCGFSSSAAFAHAFKQQYGVSASLWRSQRDVHGRKIDQTEGNDPHQLRKPLESWDLQVRHTSGVTTNLTWRIAMKQDAKLEANVRVEDIEPVPVAYVRHVGPYQGNDQLFGELFGKLMRWAGPRNLIGPAPEMFSVYHDSPDLTDQDKLRLSVCLRVPEATQAEGDVGRMTIPGGRYGVAHFEIDMHQYGDAWAAVYGGWLPQSGFEADDRPAFEKYLNDPEQHPEGKHVFEIWIPVKPA